MDGTGMNTINGCSKVTFFAERNPSHGIGRMEVLLSEIEGVRSLRGELRFECAPGEIKTEDNLQLAIGERFRLGFYVVAFDTDVIVDSLQVHLPEGDSFDSGAGGPYTRIEFQSTGPVERQIKEKGPPVLAIRWRGPEFSEGELWTGAGIPPFSQRSRIAVSLDNTEHCSLWWREGLDQAWAVWGLLSVSGTAEEPLAPPLMLGEFGLPARLRSQITEHVLANQELRRNREVQQRADRERAMERRVDGEREERPGGGIRIPDDFYNDEYRVGVDFAVEPPEVEKRSGRRIRLDPDG